VIETRKNACAAETRRPARESSHAKFECVGGLGFDQSGQSGISGRSQTSEHRFRDEKSRNIANSVENTLTVVLVVFDSPTDI